MQLNKILVTIKDPQYKVTSPATAVTKPSPNPVSTLLRPGTGNKFDIIFPISKDGGAIVGDTSSFSNINIDPKSVKIGPSGAINPTGGMVALSVFDFANFALQVEQGFDLLDKKIREILDGNAITCP